MLFGNALVYYMGLRRMSEEKNLAANSGKTDEMEA